MLNVMIVDDEMLVKVGLRNVIDWEGNGYVLAGDAGNGEAALALARRIRPDIVLTDIRMPKMDGLTLIGILRQELPATKFVILSAYGEFDYMQQAIRLGVREYILKLSMEPDALLAVLNRLKAEIEAERAQTLALEEAAHQQRTYEMERRSQQIRRIAAGDDSVSCADFLPEGAKLGVCCCYLRGIARQTTPNEIARRIETAGNAAGLTAFYIDENRYGFTMAAEGQAAWLSVLESLAGAVQAALGCKVVFVAGGIAQGAAQWPAALRQAVQALPHGFYSNKPVLSYAETRSLSPVGDDPAWGQMKVMLRDNRLDLFEAALLNRLDEIAKGREMEPASLCHTCAHLLEGYADKLGVSSGEGALPADACAHINDLRRWTAQFFADKQREKALYYGDDIARALNYIDAHYAQSLRLSDLAALLYKNETYISHLFKKRMGISFIDYLTLVRIQKAKSLLATADLHLSDIAAQTGFNDVAYFCRVFKRQTQLSPQQYRRRIVEKRTKGTT